MARAAPASGAPARRSHPTVSLIICAYNEERDIRRKLEETLACDYPPDRLEVIVASDGSTDRTDDIVREFAPRVPGCSGSRGAAARRWRRTPRSQAASGEILVFSDVTTVYAPGTIRAMVENFADPAVGCVGGDLHYEKDPHNPSAQGRALFWSYERQLRIWESQVHSIIGVAGCVYAMRRELYLPLDAGAISDFVQPGHGDRARLAHRARARRRWRTSRSSRTRCGEELYRRARVITRGLRGAFRMPELLNPLRHPVVRHPAVVAPRAALAGAGVPADPARRRALALAGRGGRLSRWCSAAQLAVYGAGLVAFAPRARAGPGARARSSRSTSAS